MRSRLRWVAALILLSCLGALTSTSALAQATSSFNLPAQPLADSLRAVAGQTNSNVLFDKSLVLGLSAKPLKANLSVQDALKRLLSGTGLTYRYLDEKTVTIVPVGSALSDTTGAGPAPPNVQPPPSTEGSKVPAERFRVAQVDQGPLSGASTVEKKDNQTAKKKGDQLEEVVVTGSRLPQTSKEGAMPVQTYTRDDIAKSGQTTVADFLNGLPSVSMISSEGEVQQLAGQTTIQLHGLPVGTTLVLVNGQRVQTSFEGFFDLGNIPVSAIERIDVLPVGSSAIYGSDALGGAVNMILRRDISGIEINAKYGSAKGGTNETDLNAAWGRSFDRGSLSIVGTYQGRQPLFGADRNITSSITDPSGATSVFASDACDPGNVFSLSGQNLPGLAAPVASVPPTTNGRPTPLDFQRTAGKTNLCTSTLTTAFIPETRREGVLASGHIQVSSALDAFSDFLYSNERQENRVGNLINLPSYAGYTLGANNPYNPFGEEVGLSYTYPGVERSYKNDQYFLRALVGARGALSAHWDYEASVVYSKDNSDIRLTNADSTAIQDALNSSAPATALNPFATSGAPGTAALMQSLDAAAPVSTFTLSDQVLNVQGLLRGTLFVLPSGAALGVFGSEWMREKQLTAFPYGSPPTDLARDSYAVFTEERIPLWADRSEPGASAKLALNIAARYDRSADYGGKATFQGGLEFRPTHSVLLRASYATSYKAPQLQETSAGTFLTYDQLVTDPLKGGQSFLVPVVQASNPDVKPETGKSKTLGFVYSPTSAPALRVALTWYSVDITNYIGVPDPQTLVNYSNLFAGGVVRNSAGMITQINDLYFNFGGISVRGTDFDAQYAWDTPWGKFTPSVAVTYTSKWESALTPGSPAVSNLSQATAFGPGFSPRWKGNTSLGWEQGPYSMSATGRYLGRYADYQDFGANSNVLGNVWLIDTNARWKFGELAGERTTLFHNAYLEAGAVNVFDRQPQKSYFYFGYDPFESSIRGRFVYVQLGTRL